MAHTKVLFSILLYATIGWLVLEPFSDPSRFLTLKGQGLTATNHSNDFVCLSLNEAPILHDKRRENAPVLDFVSHGLEPLSFSDHAKPILRTIRNAHFMLREPEGHLGMHTRMSVWNEHHVLLNDDHSLIPPNVSNPRYPTRILPDGGDYFVYSNMGRWGSHPGHFKHDVLPKIAYFRSVLPETTQFIFPRVYHEILFFLDETFCQQRVVWIRSCFDCLEIAITHNGTLTVPIHNSVYPYTAYHDLYNPLRTWLQTSKTMQTRNKKQQYNKKKSVIYYKRLAGRKLQEGEAAGGRVLDPDQERDLLQRIHEAMTRHDLDYQLIVFDGSVVRDNGDRVKMPLEQQYQLFRNAQTIIGPHGTGLGANLIWIDPAPKDCASRVQLLEFIPGQDSFHVHPLEDTYPSHFPYTRGLAINYHILLYLARSKRKQTYIDLDMVDELIKRRHRTDSSRGQAKYGRVLNLQQEEELLERIRQAMVRHKRNYELVFLDGTTISGGAAAHA